MSKDCPEPPKERGKRPMTCRNCGTLFFGYYEIKGKKDIRPRIAGSQENREIQMGPQFAEIAERKVILLKNVQSQESHLIVPEKRFASNVGELGIFQGNVLY